MTPQEALDYINAAHPAKAYTLKAQFSGGENQGAFLIVATDGTRDVLKLSRNPLWLNQIKRAKAATDHLRPLGYPAPTYGLLDATDRGSFWIQNELPGEKLVNPTTEQIQNLINTIELQKDQVIFEVQGQDWCWYIGSVVFRGESGHVRVLMQFSTVTSALVSRVEGLVTGLEGKVLPKLDLVHGDYSINQILATGPQITGVLDWDQAGYGDRTQDLIDLWYSLIDLPEPRDLVMSHLHTISDPQVIKIFAAYKMLAVIAWHINKIHGDVETAAAQASTALDLLEAI